jgi:hypothetical protein
MSLDKLLQTHIQLGQLGMTGVLVDVDGFYNLLMDWGRVADIPNPERYFIDPRSEASQKAQQQNAQRGAMQQAEQKQLVAQAVELEKLRQAFEKYKTDTTNAIDVWQTKAELRFKYVELGQNAEIAEAEMVGNVAKDLVGAKVNGNGSSDGRAKPKDEPTANGNA